MMILFSSLYEQNDSHNVKNNRNGTNLKYSFFKLLSSTWISEIS